MMTNRRSSLLTRSVALTLFVIALPGIACAFDPYGTWMRPSTGTQVNFYDCGGKLCAKIVAVKDERRKSKIGTVIMPGATKSADNQWKGDLLNADDGKIYTGVVTMQGPRQVAVGDRLHSSPRKSTSLASTHQRAVPTFDHVMAEC